MNFINPFSIPEPAVFAVPVFLFFVLLEWVVLTKIRHEEYDISEAAASIGMGIGVAFFNVLSKFFYLSVFFWIYQFRIFESLGPDNQDGFFSLSWHTSHWWVWVLMFFADDFVFYWFHRFAHEVRILWAGHVNHHSSQDFNYATALRQGWWEDLYKYIFWLGLPLLGFHPIMMFFMMQFNLIYQFFPHTEMVKKLGFLEYIFNTPSHHRVHHASDLMYLDKNYGGILIIWDRIFGTFQEETTEPHYGLTTNINTKNLLKIASHELIAVAKDVARAPKLSDKLKYLFYAPGWSHDGEDKRAKTLTKNPKSFKQN